MAITSGYFNSVNGDRKYNADQMSEYFEGIINEGVCQHIGGGLAVTAGTGLTVSVATGKAFIGQKWIKNDAALTLTITTAADQARIDAVVLRRNNTNRVCEIAVKTGTPSASPSAPAMTRTSTTYEMALAYVNVAAGATSVTVTDKRADTTVCGWATVAQSTSGEVDAQLNALKTGFDGETYSSPAAMVQGEDQKLSDKIDGVNTDVYKATQFLSNVVYFPKYTQGGYYDGKGNYHASDSWGYTPIFPVKPNTTYYLNTVSAQYYTLYDSNYTVIQRTMGGTFFATDADTAYARISVSTNNQAQCIVTIGDTKEDLKTTVLGGDNVDVFIETLDIIPGIIQSNGTWGGISQPTYYKSKVVDPDQIGYSCTIKAGSNDAHVGFLSSIPSGLTDGDPVDYCDGLSGRQVITAGATQTFTVPNDCMAIVFTVLSNTTNRTPASITSSLHSIRHDLKLFTKPNDDSNYYDIIFWGDSLTAGAGGSGTTYPGVCASELGLTHKNCGVGGEHAGTIAARMGANSFRLPVGEVNGTYALSAFTDDFGINIVPLRQGNGSNSVNPIKVNGKECTLTINQESTSDPNATYTISGYSGSALSYKSYIETAGSHFKSDITVIFVGQNGPTSLDQRITYIDSMIAKCTTKKYVVLTLSSGTESERSTEDTTLLSKYGVNLFLTRKMLVNYGLAVEGLTPTTQDETDIAAGKVPTSLRYDAVHLNAYGYDALGKMLANKIRSLGYVD